MRNSHSSTDRPNLTKEMSAEEGAGPGLAELKSELGECMLANWKLCAAGVLLGLPISMHRKAYMPFVVGGVLGSAADYYQGYTVDCLELRQRVEAMEAAKKAAEGTSIAKKSTDSEKS